MPRIRIRAAGRTASLSFESTDSFAQLVNQIASALDVPPAAVSALKSGFPPRPLVFDGPEAVGAAIGDQETVIVTVSGEAATAGGGGGGGAAATARGKSAGKSKAKGKPKAKARSTAGPSGRRSGSRPC